jgi:hypothetical protein
MPNACERLPPNSCRSGIERPVMRLVVLQSGVEMRPLLVAFALVLLPLILSACANNAASTMTPAATPTESGGSGAGGSGGGMGY